MNPSASEEETVNILFLGRANSTRTQMAEALLSARGRGLFGSASAGIDPAPRVHPLALATLADLGMDWSGRTPKPTWSVADVPWDLVISVCDPAVESCPALPHQSTSVCWRLPDPVRAVGDDQECRAAFRNTALTLGRRIDLLLSLPPHRLKGR